MRNKLFVQTIYKDTFTLLFVCKCLGNHPPLMLTLGYSQGVQVWIIPVTGEAQEVLAWRQGQVKTLKCLPTPENCFGSPDNFAHCRPLVVMVDTTGEGFGI